METKLEITNLITPIINSFKTLNNEWKHLFDVGISEYLQVQTEKYYFTNTFIHRSEKVRFDDIYYPIKATYKKLTTPFENLQEIFENYKNITLVGSAGSGKTTLLKFIFLNTIKAKIKIPILIELRNLNDFKGDFEKLITEKILKTKVKPTDDTFIRALESGRFLFLLDGYDEIFSNKKQDINRQIELFVDSYPKNNFLITTRPGSGIEGFPSFYDFQVNKLENSDVEGFINKLVNETERAKRILETIKDPKNKNYTEYLRNPLLLSMFIMAFESHPEIPSKKSSFYRNVFDTLYSKHDGITKNSFPREKLTKLQRDEFERVLNIFSYLSLMEGRYSFTEEYLTDILIKVKKTTEYNFAIGDLISDLRTTISILILDGFEYNFPHRSMQEYFTAQFISSLPSEKKTVAYKNLFKILEKSSTDRSFNLWSICNELDHVFFTVNFILPKLRIYEKELVKSDDTELLKSYTKFIRPLLFLTKTTPEKSGTPEVRILRSSSFFSSLINFCEIYKHLDFAIFPRTSGANKELLPLFKNSKGNPVNMIQLTTNSEAIEILNTYGISELIKRYRDLLSNKILELEQEIKRKTDSIDELLNI